MADQTDRQDIPLDPRVYFAAERTLLAWVRTGLAMMGFGFVVARFGLFLRELAGVPGMMPYRHTGFSLGVGTTLIILGVVVNLAASVKHWLTVRRLERGQPMRLHALSLGTVVALLLGLLGLLMATYLVVGLDRTAP
jgi:putative membrane protein